MRGTVIVTTAFLGRNKAAPGREAALFVDSFNRYLLKLSVSGNGEKWRSKADKLPLFMELPLQWG